MAQKKYVSLEKLGLYDEKIKKYLADADAVVLADSKKYTDDSVALCDAAGAAATAEANAKAYADGKDAAIAEAKKAGTDAQAAAEAAQTDVDNLEKYVGTFTASEGVDTVVKYIDAKTENIASDETVNALVDRVTQAENDIDALEADHLIKADKTELEGKITTAQTAADTAQGEVDALEIVVDTLASTHATDKQALEDKIAEEIKAVNDGIADTMSEWSLQLMQEVARELNTLKGEDARIVGLVEDEAERAAGVEAGLEGRIETMEAFWEAAQADGTDSNVIDTLKEIQEYITGDETGASEMLASIKQNSDDIDALETAVAKKAEQTALDAEVTARTQADSALDTRLKAVESAVDESGSVATDIADAKSEAISEATATAAQDATQKANEAKVAAIAKAEELNTAMDTRVDTLEAASATHAKQTDLTALTTRVTTTEGEIDTLQTEMDAVQALADAADKAAKANAAAIALKASQADLDSLEARVDAVELWQENMVECTETDINDLFVAQ